MKIIKLMKIMNKMIMMMKGLLAMFAAENLTKTE
jgi:hypothetical protein